MNINNKLIELNENGNIPRENENFTSFFERITKQKLNPNFGFKIDYSSKNIRFYELACTLTDGDHTVVEINPIFLKKKIYLGVSKDEIIEHEKVHYIRQGFKGNLFEESLAYFQSPSWIRRYLGGLLQTPKESVLAIFFSFFILITTLIDFYTPYFMYGYAVLIFSLSLRSVICHIFLQKLKKKLDAITKFRGFECLIRLSQNEIIKLNKLDSWNILKYLEESKNCPRIAMICAAYLEG